MLNDLAISTKEGRKLFIQVSQVNRKPSSWDIKGAQGFPHIAENE